MSRVHNFFLLLFCNLFDSRKWPIDQYTHIEREENPYKCQSGEKCTFSQSFWMLLDLSADDATRFIVAHYRRAKERKKRKGEEKEGFHANLLCCLCQQHLHRYKAVNSDNTLRSIFTSKFFEELTVKYFH